MKILLAFFMLFFTRGSVESEVFFMKLFLKRVVCIAFGITMICGLILFPVNAIKAEASGYTQGDGIKLSEDTRKTLEKGTTKYNGVDYSGAPYYYNPLYYYLNYSDLRDAFGPNPELLIKHYVEFGIKEKRVADKQIVIGPYPQSSSYEYVVPSYQKTSKKQDGMVVISGNLHSNGGMTRAQEVASRDIAYQIAQHVYDHVKPKHDAYKDGDQIKMVVYATGIVRAYCDLGVELTQDQVKSSNSKIYRTAYGVFIGQEYTCAGSTRALGLILDYLDAVMDDDPPLKWVHVNANKWDDQWCQIVCDNHEAYADPINSWAGYGKHPNQGGAKKDIKNYYNYANESDVITINKQKVD